MSLTGALRSGVSGISGQSQSMAMISDNIANVNTTGYKISKPQFSTLVTAAASNTQFSSGGVQSIVGRQYDSQGLLESSEISTDLAIQGDGFFTVTDEVTQNATSGDYERTGDIFYTRAGDFRPDKDGNLVNSSGHYLLGWGRNSTNDGFDVTNVQSAFEPINVSVASSSPTSTSSIDLSANLSSSAATSDTFDATMQIFDRQGTQKTLTVTFTKTSNSNEWDVSAALSGGGQFIDPDDDNDSDATIDEGAGSDTADDLIIGDDEETAVLATDVNTLADASLTGTSANLGTITFNGDGSLATVNSDLDAGGTDISFDGNNTLQFLIDHDADNTTGDDISVIDLDLGNINGTDGITQFSGSSTINSFDQNGEQFGSLTGLAVDEAGVVTALFDNGSTRELYQVPVTTFNNPNGLEQKTGNTFIETDESGGAVAHVANSGGAGEIAPSTLESSTVDLALEFTDMITTQRAYSASTKIITTADEMLDELLRTKR